MKKCLNDDERRLWVLNDEGLYNWWKSERGPIRLFICKHRAELDELILKQINKPPRS